MTIIEPTRRQALVLGLSAVTAGVARAQAPQPTGWAAVDAEALALINDHGAPGVSISVSKAGRLIYSKGFGMADLETATPAAPTSVYKIGSITKQFTAAALLALAEEGKLSVDDPLARYFPSFPRSGEITLRQMLSHTSGLGNYTNTPKRETFVQESRLDYDADALYQLMLQTKPLFAYEPGTVWSYSNTAFVLLGLIAQKVAGEPYAAFYKRRLYDRAGLTRTAVDDAATVVEGRASGYTLHPGDPARFDNASFISMTIPGGAGSMRSTSEDLCAWHTALFGGKVISLASVAQMKTPERLKDGSLPKAAAEPGAKTPPQPVQYGFGLQTTTMEGHQAIGHGGGIFGFSSSLDTFPAEGVTFAVLINCDGGARLAAHAKTLREVVVRASLAQA